MFSSLLIPSISWNALFSAALHVDGGEVHAPLLPRFLEQVVRHLLRHRVVVRLRNLEKI